MPTPDPATCHPDYGSVIVRAMICSSLLPQVL